MKKLSLFISIVIVLFCFAGCGASQSSDQTSEQTTSQANTAAASTENSAADSNSKVLVAYFSATGNTKAVAETIANSTGADLFEIVPANEYTADDLDYSKDGCRANVEQQDSATRPEISTKVDNFDSYDTVIIGYPIWWGEEPRIIDTFIGSYDFSNKTVASFCTSGSSGVETSESNIKAMCPNSVNWAGSKRFASNAAAEDVNTWINDELKIL